MARYEADFFGWANEQAALLRAGRVGELDAGNLAEEIESMGRSEKRELVDGLAVLMTPLLKWAAQPNLQGRSWQLTIEGQRDMLGELLGDNPSLRPRLADAFATAFRLSLRRAELETGLDRRAFPAMPPWTAEQVLDAAYVPG